MCISIVMSVGALGNCFRICEMLMSSVPTRLPSIFSCMNWYPTIHLPASPVITPNGIRHELIMTISPAFISLHSERDDCAGLLIAISSAGAFFTDSVAARIRLRMKLGLMIPNSWKQ